MIETRKRIAMTALYECYDAFTSASIRKLAAAFPLLIFASCMDPHAPDAPKVDESSLFHSLRLEYKNIYMAVGETVTPQVYPISIKNDTFSVGRSKLEWNWSGDNISIDSLGNITASSVSGTIQNAVVTLFFNGVERKDTLSIQVFDNALDVKSLKITSLDSARKGNAYDNLFDLSFIDARAWDSNDQPLSQIELDVKFSRKSSMPAFSGIFPFGGGTYGLFMGNAVGPVWVKASGWFFGRYLRDSTLFTGLYPSQISIQLNKVVEGDVIVFEAPITYIQPCGIVRFVNNTDVNMRIVFDKETSGIECGGVKPPSGAVAVSGNSTIDKVISVTGEIGWKAVLDSDGSEIRGVSGKLTIRNVEDN